MTKSPDTDLQESIEPVANAGPAEIPELDDSTKPRFSAKELEKIVTREREKAHRKGKEEALMTLDQQQAPAPQDQAPAPQQAPTPGIGGMPAQQQMSPDYIQQLIAEQVPLRMQQHVQEAQLHQLASSFDSKIKAAGERHPELKKKMDLLDFNDPSILGLVHLTNNMENTGDIWNELLDNPTKLSGISTLAAAQPKLAEHHLQALSNSIKQNQQALADHQSASEPLSQIKPTQKSGVDNGNMSVADFQKMFRQKKY